MRQIFLFIAILLATASGAQRQSQSELIWEQVSVVYSKENESGSYYTYEPKIEKTTYFKLVWGGGVSYAVISVLPRQKGTYFNILGQKTNLGWLIH